MTTFRAHGAGVATNGIKKWAAVQLAAVHWITRPARSGAGHAAPAIRAHLRFWNAGFRSFFNNERRGSPQGVTGAQKSSKSRIKKAAQGCCPRLRRLDRYQLLKYGTTIDVVTALQTLMAVNADRRPLLNVRCCAGLR